MKIVRIEVKVLEQLGAVSPDALRRELDARGVELRELPGVEDVTVKVYDVRDRDYGDPPA